MTIRIEEDDIDSYENLLLNMGWKQVVPRIYRKTFGNTQVEIREHLPAFSNHLELVASFNNPEGCSGDMINRLLEELKNADTTPDKDK